MLEQLLATNESARIRDNLAIATRENRKFRGADDPDGIIYTVRNELEDPDLWGSFLNTLNRKTYDMIKRLGFQEGYEPHIYQSDLWRKAKIYYLLLFGNLSRGFLQCQECGDKYWKRDQLGLCNQYQFVIHHTYYHWRLFFDPRCIQIICYACHKQLHKKPIQYVTSPLQEVTP